MIDKTLNKVNFLLNAIILCSGAVLAYVVIKGESFHSVFRKLDEITDGRFSIGLGSESYDIDNAVAAVCAVVIAIVAGWVVRECTK